MVFRYNTKQQAIEARSRIARLEGLPKFPNSATIYFVSYIEINGNYYINCVGFENRSWYANEFNQADEVLQELPQNEII